MRKFLVSTVLVLAIAGIGSAAPVPCPTTTTLAQLVALSGAGNGCISQDKIFNDFSYTTSGSTAASNVGAILVFQPGPNTQDIHGWVFAPTTGPWTSGFTLAYSITVSPTAPLAVITDAKDQINSGLLPNGVVMTDTQVPSSGPTTTITTAGQFGAESAQATFSSPTTSVMTSSTLTLPSGNLLQSYTQNWFQAEIPEPSTIGYALLGGGFLLLGLLRFKKEKEKT